MKIIGRANTTGERRRSTIPGQRRRSIAKGSHVSISAGGMNIAAMAQSSVGRAFAGIPNANVMLGKPSAKEYSQNTKA
jgi:hypothetical protein